MLWTASGTSWYKKVIHASLPHKNAKQLDVIIAAKLNLATAYKLPAKLSDQLSHSTVQSAWLNDKISYTAQNGNSRSHQKHSFTNTLQSCHGMSLAREFHNSFTSWLSTVINCYNSPLNFTKDPKCLGQHLVGNVRWQIFHTQCSSMCSKSNT